MSKKKHHHQSAHANPNADKPAAVPEVADSPGITTEPAPITETMEVHHHGHVHHNKKWKEYFFQFFMLFLAVFCGFLAEYKLEHVIEDQRELEYVTSLISNLQDDTASIRNVIGIMEENISSMDSLLALKHSDIADPKMRDDFYKFCFNGFFSNGKFHSNDATMSQLRNSGGFRLIRKDGAADSIAQYQQRLVVMNYQSDAYEKLLWQSIEFSNRLIDVTVFADTAYIKEGMRTAREFPPVSTDEHQLKEFYNSCFFSSASGKHLLYGGEYLEDHLDYATRLIHFLKKTYKIQ